MKTRYFPVLFIFLSIVAVAQNDTLNRTDANNLKQGYWIIYDETRTKVMEEGRYMDNKKEGVWKKYFENGKLENEITYQRNKPNGYAKFYYDNGNVSEEGLWQGNKWIGNYMYYFKNGQPAYEWKYNEQGKRTGEQKYYHENGNLMIEGNWQEGKETGVIKEYFADGSLKTEKSYQNGKMDSLSVKNYNQGSVQGKNPVRKTTTVQKEQKNVDAFNGEGQYKLYNNDKKVEREGEFKDNKLYNGKKYHYDEKGNLKKISVYRNGNIVDVIYNEKNNKSTPPDKKNK